MAIVGGVRKDHKGSNVPVLTGGHALRRRCRFAVIIVACPVRSHLRQSGTTGINVREHSMHSAFVFRTVVSPSHAAPKEVGISALARDGFEEGITERSVRLR